MCLAFAIGYFYFPIFEISLYRSPGFAGQILFQEEPVAVSEDKPHSSNLVLTEINPGNHQFITRHWMGISVQLQVHGDNIN